MIILLSIVLLFMGAFYMDVWKDKRKRVKIVKPIPLFDDWKRSEKQQKIADASPGEMFKVARIRYGKDYMAIKVQRDDKSNGWVIYQRGSVELLEETA